MAALRTPAPPARSSPAKPSEQKLELAFWQSIEQSTNSDDFEAYLEQYPNGEFVSKGKKNSRMELVFWQPYIHYACRKNTT